MELESLSRIGSLDSLAALLHRHSTLSDVTAVAILFPSLSSYFSMGFIFVLELISY